MVERLPGDWYEGAPVVDVDREEIVVVGRIPDVEVQDGADDAVVAAGRAARVARFREETRAGRVAVAREAEHRFGRKVAWGVTMADERVLFTHIAVPVMTRLRQPERRVLDTLVDAGVARSRSDALSWCVKLVAKHQEDWIAGLRDALRAVENLREQGPR
ncbi:MAG: hypothetical protein AVDCRST_MAG50-1172 [uncultured Acidimicrobiales bacterium]|uniref:Uncharacterized protein n=1 Tax=uncultured Acidimicrobiales bacterium TaxID=310071 RepID=A0A6J4HSD7_9ACTN|nr:MAG: hypothetical protein AVDCRST_MAG50-1172 [uncultured Acidimicrobiales bacterium]